MNAHAMPQQTTVVRLRKSAKGTGGTHNMGKHSHEYPNAPDDLSTVEVRVCLPPVAPSWNWVCGTELVWRLAPGEAERLTGQPEAWPIFLCEHQVDVD